MLCSFITSSSLVEDRARCPGPSLTALRGAVKRALALLDEPQQHVSVARLGLAPARQDLALQLGQLVPQGAASNHPLVPLQGLDPAVALHAVGVGPLAGHEALLTGQQAAPYVHVGG